MSSIDGVPLFAPELADTISGFDPKSFEQLAAVEDDHFWFVPRGTLLTQLVTRYFPKAERILEIGCGNGAVLSALQAARPDLRLVGSELHPTGLSFARRRLGAGVELVQMDARRIMAEEAFDVIGAFDVIEHITEDADVLSACRRALRPGGGVVIAVPQHPWLWSAADEVAHHVRRYRRGELERRLVDAGFKVAFSSSFCATLLPMMVASRWHERLTRAKDKPATASDLEFSPPKPINVTLKAILKLEVAAILAGLRFPVGGSRVVVAMRD